jgi:pimeloyl-ACP methyl ester carboxylesterase
MAKALTSTVKNRWLRKLLSFPAGFMSFLLTRTFYPGSIFNSKLEPFALVQEHLTDPTLIPPCAPRLYIYSTPDQLVPVQDVEAHIERAKAKGVKSITVLKDETSGHVDHLRRDPVAYWETIRKLWARV